jgi:hypothetical protein
MRGRHSAVMNGTGLDDDGFIEREGDLARVPQAFAPVIEATKAAILRAFGPSRLHSAYLYGWQPSTPPCTGGRHLGITRRERQSARRGSSIGPGHRWRADSN